VIVIFKLSTIWKQKRCEQLPSDIFYVHEHLTNNQVWEHLKKDCDANHSHESIAFVKQLLEYLLVP